MRLGIIISMCLLVSLCSCSTQYNISGNSSVATLDGRMLYLKTCGDDDIMLKVDSCEVVHGKFNFMGVIDSVCMGELFMGNESVMPVVIETGDISILINDLEQRVTGGSLNNRLYQFLGKRTKIENQIMELSHQEAHLILAGNDPFRTHKLVQKKTDELYEEITKLETEFVLENDNNVLGSTYFMVLCNQYPYPIITSQIKNILKKSSDKFRNLPFVRTYVNAAEQNMQYMIPANN